jgi:predicted GTPase
VSRLLRTYWRQIAILALMTLPLAVLMVLGVVWLLHSPWFVPSFIAMAAAGLTTAYLARSIHRSRQAPGAPLSPADGAWAPAEVQAWGQVQAIATQVQAHPPQSLDEVQQLADQVVQAVAQQLHGKNDFAWARFTLPEILHAVEQAAQHLRVSVRSRVPGAESITVAEVMALRRWYLKHESKGQMAWWAYRLFRLSTAPQVAVVQELKGAAQGAGFDASWSVVQGWMARLLAEELGRSAINLYSGRFRLTQAEARQSLLDAAPTPQGPVPVRILMAGQVNAGKSSLTNALLGSVQSPVSELPTPGGIQEFRIAARGELDLVVLDTPGLNAMGANQQLLLDACAKVDLIVWVVQANQAARAPDVAALKEIRDWFASRPEIKPPPMVLVMTHVDRLGPAREWTPPYDLVQAGAGKAGNIRLALEQVGTLLAFGDQPMVPVALRLDEAPYNLPALWSAIGASLGQAQLTALDRGLKQGLGFSLAREFGKCCEGGRFIVGKLWADRVSKASSF